MPPKIQRLSGDGRRSGVSRAASTALVSASARSRQGPTNSSSIRGNGAAGRRLKSADSSADRDLEKLEQSMLGLNIGSAAKADPSAQTKRKPVTVRSDSQTSQEKRGFATQGQEIKKGTSATYTRPHFSASSLQRPTSIASGSGAAGRHQRSTDLSADGDLEKLEQPVRLGLNGGSAARADPSTQTKRKPVAVRIDAQTSQGKRGFATHGQGIKKGTSASYAKPRFSVSNLQTPADIAKALGDGHFRQVVCLVGAGASTASGIPDFRTKGTGLYDNLVKFKLPEPEAIFDLDFYEQNPEPFLMLAKDLYPGKYQPNTSHYFMRLLHDKKVLHRIYTQNIDGLERLAGIPADKLVEAHGTFSSASCLSCRRAQDTAAVKSMIMEGRRPRCVQCKGLVKPDIVFFGEDLPSRFYRMYRTDLKACDLLIVMGTSLSVEPFASLVDEVRSCVPRLLVNRELVGPFSRRRRSTRRLFGAPDLALQGDLGAELQQFCVGCNWGINLQDLEDAGKPSDSKSPTGSQPPEGTDQVASCEPSHVSDLPFVADETTSSPPASPQDVSPPAASSTSSEGK